MKGKVINMKDRISNLMMEVSGIYIYKNNHMVLDIDKIISNIIDDLKAEIKELKAENEKLRADECESIGWIDQYKKGCEEYRKEIAELKAENERLSIDNLEKVKVINDANKQTIAERVKHYGIEFPYPKEYKAEADEYFSHNPKSKYVAFYMLSEYDVRDGERGDLMLYKDDAIVVIDNDNS